VSQAEDGIEPGRRFATEIREQPAALRRLLEHDGEIARVAATVRERDARLVRIVGHGSSDNAASFGDQFVAVATVFCGGAAADAAAE